MGQTPGFWALLCIFGAGGMAQGLCFLLSCVNNGLMRWHRQFLPCSGCRVRVPTQEYTRAKHTETHGRVHTDTDAYTHVHSQAHEVTHTLVHLHMWALHRNTHMCLHMHTEAWPPVSCSAFSH